MKILGTHLHVIDRAIVLRAYVHRMTTESRRQFPEFTRRMLAHGYRMPEQTDVDWLASTYFEVRKDGRLDNRFRSCENTQKVQ